MKKILFAALLFTAACTTKEPTPSAESTAASGGGVADSTRDTTVVKVPSGDPAK